jgi:hypothetical protein
MKWAMHAVKLDDKKPMVHLTLTALYLNQGDDKSAERSARRFIELVPDRDRAYFAMQGQERRRPESPMWARLRADYSDFPQLPLESMPATRPAITEAAGDAGVTTAPVR